MEKLLYKYKNLLAKTGNPHDAHDGKQIMLLIFLLPWYSVCYCHFTMNIWSFPPFVFRQSSLMSLSPYPERMSVSFFRILPKMLFWLIFYLFFSFGKKFRFVWSPLFFMGNCHTVHQFTENQAIILQCPIASTIWRTRWKVLVGIPPNSKNYHISGHHQRVSYP